jgi:hypothetical protein
MAKDQIKLNCYCISYKLYKILWKVYKNKLYSGYEHVISCFHKLSQTVSQIFNVSHQISSPKQTQNQTPISYSN